MANVSRTTVSRVINNNGYVSEEARKRVLEVIKKTGYVPSQHAKSLRTKKSKVIGVIIPRINTETSSKVVQGIDQALMEKGYHILLMNTNLDRDKEIEFLKLLQSRQVEGIILLATNNDHRLATEIKKINIPVIVVGQELPDVPNIVFNDYEAAKYLTNYLIDKGRKNIAFIGVDEKDHAVGVLRKKGYMDALKEKLIPIEESIIRTATFSIESGYATMKTLFESSVTIDAVFTATDRLAVGAIQYLKENNILIPEQVCIAGIGASDLSKYISPSLTTIEYEYSKAGETAGKLMLNMIENDKKDVIKSVLNYRIIERDSV